MPSNGKTNLPAQRQTSTPAAAPARTGYGRFADERTAPNFVGQLLRFTKTGEYQYGQDRKELEEGTQLIAGMFTLRDGWVKWQDGKPVKQLLELVEDGIDKPDRSELGDLDESQWEKMGEGRAAVPRDPWQETSTLVMADPDTGDLFTFSANSKGGRDALMALAGEYDEHLRQKPDEIPVIELGSSSYKHRVYGQIFKPEFKVVDWVDKDAVSLDGEEDNEAVEAASTKKVVTKITPIKKGGAANRSRSRL